MILLTKNNTDPPEPYSNDDSDPIFAELTFDGSGTPATVIAYPTEPIYLWCNDHLGTIDRYIGVGIELLDSEPGITWELSLNGTTGWVRNLSLGDFDVSVQYQTLRVFARVTALNDGSLITNNYTVARFLVNGTGKPI